MKITHFTTSARRRYVNLTIPLWAYRAGVCYIGIGALGGLLDLVKILT